MQVSITFAKPEAGLRSFPPQLAKLGSDEIVLVELQGELEVQGEKAGGVIGTLSMKNAVSKLLDVNF